MKRRDVLKEALLAALARPAIRSGAGLSLLGAAAAVRADEAPAIRWRLSSSFPKSVDAIYGAAERVAKRVGEVTDGKFQIRVFAGGEIVPGLQVLDAVGAGTVECGQTAGYYYVGKNMVFAFETALPFGLNARQQIAWMYAGGGRELMRDRPTVSLPDDHDVYQGNLWGESGEGRKTTQAAGGYDMAADWVNAVYRTQTAPPPDPPDPGQSKRGTIQYYGPMTYGRVSIAILADRQYKSGPEGKVPPTGTPRGDHVMDPAFDPKTVDVAGAELLGARQEQFLREWAADWRGADMKAVISQTIFTALPTTHGNERMILRADYDTNAWPQKPRDRALREIRKARAFHIAGDQHIPAVVHYGIDAHRDGPVAFAGPALNVGYPRWFEPAAANWLQPKGDGLTGDFTDAFGHPLTVLAVKNGAVKPRQGDVRQLLDDKASGLGLVRFDKKNLRVVVECWPYLADVTKPGTQMPGWPVMIDIADVYGDKRDGRAI